MNKVWWFQGAVALIISASSVYCYNINRSSQNNNCGYFENPVFQVAVPVIETIDNRFGGETFNNLNKEGPHHQGFNTYQTLYGSGHAKHKFRPKVAYDLMKSREESDEDSYLKSLYDSDKLWRVDEIPLIADFQALPDVYVGGDPNAPKDEAPPIVDMMSVEKSELTEETHDMENVEIEETSLTDPGSQTAEVILETINKRPDPPVTDNPVVKLFKEILVDEKNINVKKIIETENNKSLKKVEYPKDKVREDSDKVEELVESTTEEESRRFVIPATSSSSEVEEGALAEIGTTPATKIAKNETALLGLLEAV